MQWWLWLVLGLLLMGGEILTPGGFFVIFFGVGALVVGALTGFGLAGPHWVQWLLFSVLSVGSLLLFRGKLVALTRAHGQPSNVAGLGAGVDALVGEVVVPVDDLAPGAVGKAELRGTSWTARNDGERALARGQRCRVTRVDGLTLFIRGE
jgi:membrane protein implicated in regulation of membrane protease activity